VLLIGTAALDFEPPFVPLLNRYLLAADGEGPTAIGRVVMLSPLLSVPAAFVINLLAMRLGPGSDGALSFAPTPTHTIIGLSLLLMALAIFSRQVLYELGPFVRPLGAASFLGQGLCLLALLPLPVAFLLNRRPRFALSGRGGARLVRPTSINLIVGAVSLLIVLMLLSGMALEMTACAVGVPNCD
jgi:hypothetical protein